MAEHFDAILRNGRLVDPRNGIEAVMDVAVKDGRIARIEPTISGSAMLEHDLTGKVVMPGIVDMHVHLSPWLGGAFGHRMLALAGVTTALDMAGPIEGVVDIAASHGAGLSIACINYVRSGHTVGSSDPGAAELRDTLAASMAQGAIGLKLLGGHFPLTQQASASTIAAAAERGAYVAFHAGTIETPAPSIATMVEACELAAGHPLHLAHINSYARGFVKPAIQEGVEAVEVLARHPAIWSESYLAPFNGVSAKCANGVPESLATRRGVQVGGFEPTEAGVAQSIEAGWTHIHKAIDGVIVLVTGAEGLAAWKDAQTNIGASFMVNPPEPRIHLVTAKKADGGFAVDALATDGGGIPRNDIVQRGLPLVRMSALTLAEFACKASLMPARALGLADKGHLAPGADADITVLDMDRLEPVLVYANGCRIMENGRTFPGRNRFVTPPEGVAAVEAAGLEAIVVEPGTMLPPH
ncbi:amidohydrolase family protein [Consotaella aegiceratis]|uniref:amidohydrolase family protein n=1 Tax=Consotaella aegiceratis TaxID=3097961 RepID=UPI002F423921